MRCLAPLLLLGLGGCVALEGFDPVGDQAAISGSWQIDGAAASSTSCDALGANRVRVTFLDDQRAITHSSLFFQCNSESFDSETGSGAVVAAGSWTVRLDAIDESGALVAAGTPYSQTIEEGTYDPDTGTPSIDIPQTNFWSATLSTAYQINGQDADSDRCEAAGITHVRFEIGGATSDQVRENDSEPCRIGVLGVRLQPGVTYEVQVVGERRENDEDAATIVVVSDVQMITPSAGENVELDTGGAIDLRP